MLPPQFVSLKKTEIPFHIGKDCSYLARLDCANNKTRDLSLRKLVLIGKTAENVERRFYEYQRKIQGIKKGFLD